MGRHPRKLLVLAIPAHGSRRHSASSGEKLKGSNVARPNNAEVSPIQRGQGRDPEALRRCHNRCVDSSKLQVPVSPDKLGNAQPVRRVDWFRRQASAREVA